MSGNLVSTKLEQNSYIFSIREYIRNLPIVLILILYLLRFLSFLFLRSFDLISRSPAQQQIYHKKKTTLDKKTHTNQTNHQTLGDREKKKKKSYFAAISPLSIAIPLRRLPGLALPLLLFGLEEPPPLALLYHPRPQNLDPEPPNQRLLRLVLLRRNHHVARRHGQERAPPRRGRPSRRRTAA